MIGWNRPNIANQTRCYSYPQNIDDPFTDLTNDLTDGNLDTYSDATYSFKDSYDVCVFDGGVSIQGVRHVQGQGRQEGAAAGAGAGAAQVLGRVAARQE